VYDLVLSRGQVVTEADSFEADIGVKDGKIAAITGPKSLKGPNSIDCAGLLVLPGIIDSHVHIRYPGNPEREDFSTGTMAAAAGGITTVLEMPISFPCVRTGDILRQRVAACEPGAYVDFAFYGAAGWDSVDDVRGTAEAGAIGFKTFLHGPPAGREQEFIGLCATDEASLLDVFKAVARTGLVSAIHAESNAICEKLTGAMRARGHVAPVAHAESRPEIAEIVSTASSLALAEEAGVRLQLCHMSTDRGVRMAWDARQEGLPVTVETCPHYLAADVSDLERLGPYARINPPLRSRRTVEALWECLNRGMIDTVGSDHAPYLLEEKTRGEQDIFAATCGSPGLETLLPVMLDAVNGGRTCINRLVKIMSSNAARIFGLYPRKGAIMIGSDADFTVVDLSTRRPVRRDRMYTKSKHTARLFEDKSLTGWPVMTVVRGHVVMREGQIQGKAGTGRFVAQEAAAGRR
jgi:dihydropyrimidinase/allantoinase